MIHSYTSLSLFATCPRLWYYRYVLKTPKPPESLSARFGTWMVHYPLTQWYQNLGEFRPLWDQLYEQEVAPTDDELRNKKNKPYTIANAKILFFDYVHRFENDFKTFRVLAVEERLIRDRYQSKPDVILWQPSTQTIIPMDFKSSQYDLILDSASFNQQFLGQMWSCETTTCYIVLINVAALTIERIPITVTKNDINAWERETVERIKWIEQCQWFPRNAPQSCFRFGRQCEELERCNAANNSF